MDIYDTFLPHPQEIHVCDCQFPSKLGKPKCATALLNCLTPSAYQCNCRHQKQLYSYLVRFYLLSERTILEQKQPQQPDNPICEGTWYK